jgi:hypothetical protein
MAERKGVRYPIEKAFSGGPLSVRSEEVKEWGLKMNEEMHRNTIIRERNDGELELDGYERDVKHYEAHTVK